MKKLALLCASLFFCVPWAQAKIFTAVPGARRIAGIPVAESATVEQNAQSIPLSLLGAGLRSKRVLFVNVKVYVGELFVSDAASFSKENPLASVPGQKAVAVRMTFLRDVDQGKIHDSFEESFKANGLDPHNPSLARLLEAVHEGGDVKDKQSLTVVALPGKDTDAVLYVDPQGKTSEVRGPGLAAQVLSLWLGKTTDSGVREMQKEILK